MSKGKIFLVEDEPTILELMILRFQVNGYEPQGASTVAEAQQKIQEQHPRFIISDMELPDGNGLELCRWLKSQGAISSIPIILYTANKETDIENEGLAAGAAAVIQKENISNQWVQLIEEILNGPDTTSLAA